MPGDGAEQVGAQSSGVVRNGAASCRESSLMTQFTQPGCSVWSLASNAHTAALPSGGMKRPLTASPPRPE